MARRKNGVPGLSLSWKRATGITAAKRKTAHATGIPTTRSGRQAKVGRATGCSTFLLFTAIALIVICMLPAGAFAEVYGEEIQFRGIPWLIDANSFTRRVVDDIYGSSASTRYNDAYIDELVVLYFDIDEEGYLGGQQGVGYHYLFLVEGKEFLVAGYPVSHLSGHAIYGMTDDNLVSRNVSRSRMINAEYAFDTRKIQDKDAAYLDLFDKLCDLYGDPVNTHKSEYYESVFWFGGNQTYAKLSRRLDEGALYGSFYIEYGIRNALSLISEIENAGYLTDPNNFDGL